MKTTLIAIAALTALSGVPQIAAAAADGKAIYDKTCQLCHKMGVANAPKLGDKKAWEPRIALGVDALVASAIKGKPPIMAPRGGVPTMTDEEIRAGVEYMVSKSK